MGMYDYDDYINFSYDSSYDSDGTWFTLLNADLCEDAMHNSTTCWGCTQLKKEVKRLQQLVELLQLPNEFE
jgi:hypothetical protein